MTRARRSVKPVAHRPYGFDQPGDAHLLVTLDRDVGIPGNHDVEPHPPAEWREIVRQQVQRHGLAVSADRDDAVISLCSPERAAMRMHGCDPDRRARPLHRSGPERHVHRVVAPVVADRRRAQRNIDEVQRFIELRGPLDVIDRLPERSKVIIVRGAQANSERRSTPALKWSNVTSSFTTCQGRRRASGDTRVPSRTEDVAPAITPRRTHGSCTSRFIERRSCTWSHRNTPSHPDASASTARSTISRAPAKGGMFNTNCTASICHAHRESPKRERVLVSGGRNPAVAFNIADLFEYTVDAVPDRTALVVAPRRLTFAEMDERGDASRTTCWRRFGHRRPRRHLRANCVEWVEAMLGAFKIRAVPININYRYVEDELRYLFDNADLVGARLRTRRTRRARRRARRAAAAPAPDRDRGRHRRGHRTRIGSVSLRRRCRGGSPDARLRRVARRPLHPLHRRHHRHAQGRRVAHEDVLYALGGGIDAYTNERVASDAAHGRQGDGGGAPTASASIASRRSCTAPRSGALCASPLRGQHGRVPVRSSTPDGGVAAVERRAGQHDLASPATRWPAR